MGFSASCGDLASSLVPFLPSPRQEVSTHPPASGGRFRPTTRAAGGIPSILRYRSMAAFSCPYSVRPQLSHLKAALPLRPLLTRILSTFPRPAAAAPPPRPQPSRMDLRSALAILLFVPRPALPVHRFRPQLLEAVHLRERAYDPGYPALCFPAPSLPPRVLRERARASPSSIASASPGPTSASRTRICGLWPEP